MQTWLIARITILETLRKKDFYVLLILLALYAFVSRVILQEAPKNEKIPTFLFALGLNFSFASAAILVVALAARQVPEEIAQGTILPLLARPISRAQFLAGKCLACWLAGVVSLLCFVVLIRILVPAPASLGEVLFVQTVLLKMAGLAALAAMTVLLSLLMPLVLNVTVSLGYYFFWGIMFNMLHSGLTLAGESWGPLAARALYVFPHLEVLNVSRICMSQNVPLPWGLTLSLIVYAAAYTAIALLIARDLFARRWV